MANIFVSSTAGAGLDDGSNWANAFLTFAQAAAVENTGDLIAVDVNHSELLTVSTTYNIANGVQVVSSTNTGVDTVTYQKATAVQINMTVGSDITFTAGNSGYLLGLFIVSGRDLVFSDLQTENCNLNCGNSNNSGSNFGSGGTTTGWTSINDTRHNLATGSTQPVINVSNRQFSVMQGGTISSDRVSANASHVAVAVGATSSFKMDGVDCNGFVLANLIETTASNNGRIDVTRCRFNPATVNLITDLPVKSGTIINIEAVDDANTVNRQYRACVEGELFSDSAIVLDATNPASNTISNKLVTNATTVPFFIPLRFSIINGWADFSTSKTIDIEFCQDGTTTALTDEEIWIEIQFPDDTTSAYHVENDKAADNQSAVNQTSSTAAWTGLSGTNVKQKCSVTTAATGKAGPFQVFICLAKPSTTVYVNPKPDIS